MPLHITCLVCRMQASLYSSQQGCIGVSHSHMAIYVSQPADNTGK